MKNLKYLLGIALFSQVLAFFWMYDFNQEKQKNNFDNLFSFNPSSFEKIIIDDGNDQMTLLKSNEKWSFYHSEELLPADSFKIDGFLSKIRELKADWPTAKTFSSHKRFEVAEDAYQRKVCLYSSKKESPLEFFFGSSPSFKKIHLRKKDQKEVFAVNLNLYELSTNPSEWLDKSLLSVEEINKIKGSDFSIEKIDELWVFSQDASSETSLRKIKVDAEKVENFLSALSRLHIVNLAQKEQPTSPPISLEIESSNQRWTYQFFSDENSHYISRSDLNSLFQLSKIDYEKFANISLSDLANSESEQIEENEDSST